MDCIQVKINTYEFDQFSGVFPNCVCKLGKVYDHQHSVSKNTSIFKMPYMWFECILSQICLDIDRSKCPKRSVGTVPHCECEEGYQLDDIHWYCRAWYLNDTDGSFNSSSVKFCPTFQILVDGHCEPIHCPNNRTLIYPNCTYGYEPVVPRIVCPTGQKYTIEKPYCHCPDDQDYTFPICHERCAPNSKIKKKNFSHAIYIVLMADFPQARTM